MTAEHEGLRQAGFGDHLACGLLRWDLLQPFPRQAEADRRLGDEILGDLSSYLVAEVNPAALETDEKVRVKLLADLASKGLLEMRAAPALGGLGLSELNAFRVIETLASWSATASFPLAIQNGIGAGAHLPALAEGPLRDEVMRRMAAGMISGSADTEPQGAANRFPATTAVPVDNGAAYVLNGEKNFISNAPIASMLCVSAAVAEPSGRQVQIFFVATSAPGVSVEPGQDFMGLRGHANAVVRLRDVRVPRESMLDVAQGEWRQSDLLRDINAFGRMLIIAAPALAAAKLCLHWQREFARRREVDGRPLGGYEQIQRMIADSLADVLAMQAIIDWCLLARETDLAFERGAVKNITSVTSWRVLERTMSLLAAEGYESAASKARRGVQPLPLERFYRDARMLRIGGGVDFQVDNWGAQSIFERCFYPPRPVITEVPLSGGPRLDLAVVDPRNHSHLLFVAEQAAAFADCAAKLAGRYPDPGQLFEREHLMINLNRIAAELLTMALTVAKAAGQPQLQPVADTYCTAARHRLRGYWQHVDEPPGADHAKISDSWLSGGDLDALLGDIITQTPPA